MSIALLLLTGLIGIQQAEPQSAEEIMQRVRQATNFSLEKIPETGLILEGKGTYDGVPARIRMQFNRQGHFLQQIDSVLGTRLSGYDGKDVWWKDYDGESNLLELSKRRQSLLMGALYSGLWIDKSSGMAYTLAKDVSLPDQHLLQFSHEPSQLTGTISIDKKSLLPQKCKFTVNGEYVTITWKETLSYEGMKWTRNIEIATIAKADTKSSYQWESVTAATKTDANPFRPQISPPTNMTFDIAKTALLEVKKAKSGYLLVRPLVNGKDVGSFLLSTTVDDNVLHTRTARKLELETYGDEGQEWALGASVKTTWSRPKTISLGRITLQDPLVSNMELPAEVDDSNGVPIAGIIGLGMFRCSVIELDCVTAQVALFDPKTYEQERGKKNWQRLYVSRGLGVEAEFEGHKGVFNLTTFPINIVAIYSQAVKKLNLLEGREVTFISGRDGGEEAVKKGKLKYFEIGGHRHEDVEASFATSETGPSSDHDTIGTIGGGLLKPFQIVVDYQNRRIAFVKRDAKDEREALKDAAWSAYGLGKYQEAAEKCRLAIRDCEAAKVEDQILADSLTLMGILDVINGKYSHAETSLNRALAILKKTVGADHENNTSVLIALGNLNMDRGQYQEAESLFQQALRILEKRGNENQNSIAALVNLGIIRHAQGRHQEAESHYLRVLKILEKDPNRDEEAYAAARANLGSLKVSQGKYQEAMKLYQDALKIFQDRFGNDYLYVGVVMGDLARVHGFLNQHGFSDILFERSQAIKRKNKIQSELAEADKLVKKAKENITKAQLSQAEMNLWSALRSYERGLDPDSQKVAEVYGLFAKLKETQGKDNESAYYQKRAKQISDQSSKGPGK